MVKKSIILCLLAGFLLLIGCSEQTTNELEGYIVEISPERLFVVEGISKDEAIMMSLEEAVKNGHVAHWVSFEHKPDFTKFQEGQLVTVVFSAMNTGEPTSAVASEILIIE